MSSVKKAKEPMPKGAVNTVRPVRTINDLMDDIQVEIDGIKSGDLSEAKARVITKARALQIQGFQVMLQAARLEARFRSDLGTRLGFKQLEDGISSGPIRPQ